MDFQNGSLVFDDWRIVRRLGRGASGEVFEIRKNDQSVSLTSALKVVRVPQDPSTVSTLRAEGMDERSVTAYFQSVVDSLIDEIKIMVSMKGFPYIVSCEDYKVIKEPDAMQWYVLIRMELLTPLLEHQREHGATEADVHRLGVELAKALALFEEKSIIHRDIKPGNIFVNQFGGYKLGDFGIARAYDSSSGELSIKGTENYMAPEVHRGVRYDGTADIYSLGLVLYKALNRNRLPFYPTDAYTAADRERALTERLSGETPLPMPALVSPELGQVVLKMCAFRPEDRYQNASELLRDLERCRPAASEVLPRAEDPDKTVVIPKQPEMGAAEDKTVLDERRPAHQQEKVPDPGPAADGSVPDKETGDRGAPPAAGKTKKGGGKKLLLIAAAVLLCAVLAVVLLPGKGADDTAGTAVQYMLTVSNGTGDGRYAAGQTVEVTADRGSEDDGSAQFTHWMIVSGDPGLEEAELTAQTVRFTMPAEDVVMAAVYAALDATPEPAADTQEPAAATPEPVITPEPAAPTPEPVVTPEPATPTPEPVTGYSVQVNGGILATGGSSGYFAAGDIVTVTHEPVTAGKSFSGWTAFGLPGVQGVVEEDEFTFTMPANDVVISAVWALQ